jgi:mRNA interferase YafQ
MFEIIQTRRFKISFKRVHKSGRFDVSEFKKIIEYLRYGKELPYHYRDHRLTGYLQNKRKCHISGDLLLVYEIYPAHRAITLSDIGNHAQVFGS